MERAQVSKVPPRGTPVEMVTSELEAAEALAVLSRGGASLSSGEAVPAAVVTSQGEAITQPFCGHKNVRTVESMPSEQPCSSSYKSNFVSKLRPKLTEAEKEARKLRRVLANRESARQTIRKRQAMYLELAKRAADLSEVNKNLKKQKELAVKDYNSLKDRNKFLKVQMAKLKKAKPGGTTQEDDENMSRAHILSSETSNSPIFPHGHPSLFPCVWPSILQYANVINSSQFPNPEIPLFVVPVPFVLPFLPVHSKPDIHQASTCSSSDTLMHEDNNIFQHSSNLNMRAEASNLTNLPRESMRSFLLRKSKEPIIRPLKKPEDIFAAVEARKRRKELMRLKSTDGDRS